VEVIAELATDNTSLVSDIVAKLDQALTEFGAKYVPEEFDPFIKIEWPSSSKEEEELWKPLSRLLESGPRNPSEIDQIKRSLTQENRATRVETH
jgi:hypothetical protein